MSDDDSPKKKQQIRNSTAEFLIFSAQTGGDDLEVRYEDETIWLTQKLMAHLFGVDVRTVSEHLANIYDQAELQREATIRNFRIVQTEGDREVARQVDHYNLDAIISFGYRVNSVRATQFRQWATGVLRDFAIKGVCSGPQTDGERLVSGRIHACVQPLVKQPHSSALAAEHLQTDASVIAKDIEPLRPPIHLQNCGILVFITA